jgi:hypothetical protein
MHIGRESVKWWRGKSDAKKQAGPHLVDGVSPCCFRWYSIASINFIPYPTMPVRLISLPAVVRCQVFEAYLSKRTFSISSRFNGHENPLVSS